MMSELIPGLEKMVPTQLKSKRVPHLQTIINLGSDKKGLVSLDFNVKVRAVFYIYRLVTRQVVKPNRK